MLGLGNASGLVVSTAGEDVPVAAGATDWAFVHPLQDGIHALSLQAPAGMRCAFSNDGQVVVNGADVTDVNITCELLTYKIGGAVTGLPSPGSITLGDGAGHQVTVSNEGSFTFPARLASGTSYDVAVVTPPSGRTCTVSHGTGTIATADVTNVSVTCGVSTFVVGGAVSGLAANGLTISSDIPGSTPVAVVASATRYQLSPRAPNGTYNLTIASSPAGQTCTFTSGGASRSITVAGADVGNADVTCVGVVLQRWTAPTAWGGSSQTFWADDDAALVQHAWFTSAGIHESKSVSWMLARGANPSFARLDAFPAGPRYGAGPFPDEGANFQASSTDARLDLSGDMLVCAVIQPDTDPIANGWEKPVISKGFGNYTNYLLGGGWSLMQMHESFCFHYELIDGNGESRNSMAYLPTLSANGNVYGPGDSSPRANIPPNDLRSPLPSYVVVCGGRDGEDLVIAANSADNMKRYSLAGFGPAPHTLDAASAVAATIGGYTAPLGIPGTKHVFGGRVYETAVWAEPATAANVAEKLASVQGLASGVAYERNRPGPFQFTSLGGAYTTTWHDGPRIDPAKGMLFGLQGWNRVNGWMPGDPSYSYPSIFPASEDLTLWTPSGGATLDGSQEAVSPAGIGHGAQLVTLPPGAALSIPLDQRRDNPLNPGAGGTPPPTWRSRGAVHGQIWVRVPSAQPAGSVLRIRKSDPNPDTPTLDRYDVNLDSLTAGLWTRVWLSGTRGGADTGGALSTSGSQAGVLYLENAGTAPISFHAWGIDITQIGGGGDLNSASAVPVPFSQPSPDPGPFMYDWSGANDYDGSFDPTFVQDVLQPPAIQGSTAPYGFCLSVDAQPPDALAWDTRMHDSRTAVAWANSPDAAQVSRVLRLYVDGLDGSGPGRLCFASRTLSAPGDWSTVQPEQVIACGSLPTSWSAGTPHNLKACSTATGQVSLYADYASSPAAIATGTLTSVPDLGTGRLLIGNGVNRASSFSSPWHGYVTAAAACRASDIAACR